jgi:hypothetical protein
MIGLGLNAGKQHLGCMKTAKSPESNSSVNPQNIFNSDLPLDSFPEI